MYPSQQVKNANSGAMGLFLVEDFILYYLSFFKVRVCT